MTGQLAHIPDVIRAHMLRRFTALVGRYRTWNGVGEDRKCTRARYIGQGSPSMNLQDAHGAPCPYMRSRDQMSLREDIVGGDGSQCSKIPYDNADHAFAECIKTVLSTEKTNQ